MGHGSHSAHERSLAYGLWFAAVFTVTALLAVILVSFTPGQARRRRITRAAARAVFRLTGSEPEVSGLARLPNVSCVAVANHASYLDGILLTAVLPPRFQFVVKREMTRVPLVHFLLRRIGVHFVDRSDRRRGADDLRSILQTAGAGASFAFFPEGTFNAEPGLRVFRNGAFTVALRNGMPVVPVSISGTRRMLPADTWVAARTRLEVTVHEPVMPSPGTDKIALAALCRAQIMSSLDEPDLGIAATSEI